MSLKPLLPSIALGFALSVLVMALGAIREMPFLSLLAAAFFGALMILTSLRINTSVWSRSGAEREEQSIAANARQNGQLNAIVYAWGAVAMLAIYALSPLYWQHWWQYGAAMALIAVGVYVYARWLDPAGKPPPPAKAFDIAAGLAALQGVAAIAALAFLIFSGKLGAMKSDWAANQIFLIGGIALAAVSIISVLNHLKLSKRATGS